MTAPVMATDESRTAYVDSKMAELRHGSRSKDAQFHNSETSSDDERRTEHSGDETDGPIFGQKKRQPAGLGKLQEIDLGAESTLRNIARTEAATRRLETGESAEPEELPGRHKPGKKVRLGPDGKPWRGRRNRRTSEDIARDKLVEEVLREARGEFFNACLLLPCTLLSALCCRS